MNHLEQHLKSWMELTRDFQDSPRPTIIVDVAPPPAKAPRVYVRTVADMLRDAAN